MVLSPTIIGNLAVSRFRNSHPALRRSPVELAKPCRSMKFWLVICDIAMENHQFQWVNHRFLWQFSSSLCNQLPVGAGCEQDFRRMDSIRSYQIYPHPQIYIYVYIYVYIYMYIYIYVYIYVYIYAHIYPIFFPNVSWSFHHLKPIFLTNYPGTPGDGLFLGPWRLLQDVPGNKGHRASARYL